jgi:hypothetical protein
MLIQIDPISQCDHTCAEQMKQSRPSSVSLATPKVLKARISELSYCRKNIVLLKINIMQREGVGCQTTFTTYTHFLSPHYSLQSNGIFHCLVYNKLYIWNEKLHSNSLADLRDKENTWCIESLTEPIINTVTQENKPIRQIDLPNPNNKDAFSFCQTKNTLYSFLC